jgi:hypothetical protein
MERAGFTRIAVTLGLAALLQKQLITDDAFDDQSHESYTVYKLTAEGLT